MSDASGNTEVLLEDLNCLRCAVLHRPQALNAVNRSMVDRLHTLYARWESQSNVGAVVLKGAGHKAFCAGGDVRAIAPTAGGEAAQSEAVAYFRAEDSLVYRISQLTKPHVAILDGIVMARGACGPRCGSGGQTA
jgi:enoyl-CoA hydratase/carnithine racemase